MRCPSPPQPGAKAALAEIYNAEDREHAVTAAEAFQAGYGVKWPKAAAKITDDLDVLKRPNRVGRAQSQVALRALAD